MKRLVRVCVLALACLSIASLPLRAAEDDEEAVAAKEKAAKDKIAAGKKAAKDQADKDSNPVFTGDKKGEKSDPFKEAGGAKKVPAPPVAKPDPLPSTPNAADSLCVLCKGVGLLPNTPYKPYIKFEGQPPPSPDFVAAWKYCPNCMPGKTAENVSSDMKERQQKAIDKHKGFEDDTGKPLVQYETPFVTVRSMLKWGDNSNVAKALEKCAGILQGNSKTMVLLSTRPDIHDLILMSDDATYQKYIDNTWAPNDGEGKALTKKLSGTSNPLRAALRIDPPPSAPAESRAVFSWAGLLMLNATNLKAKPWLMEGFSAYCENATLDSNLNLRIAYEMNDKVFKTTGKGKPPTWNEEVKAGAKINKLKSWPEIFGLDLVNMKMIEYQTCYSIASYLIKTDPAKFDNFVLNLAAGDENTVALEKAYGKKVKDLQADWMKWVMTQK